MSTENQGTAGEPNAFVGARMLCALTGHKSPITRVAWAPDGSTLATSSADCTVRIWDLDTAAECSLLRHPEPVLSIAWSPDGQRIATLGMDKRLRIWDLASHETRYVGGELQGSGFDLSWSPEGSVIALDGLQEALLWEVARRRFFNSDMNSPLHGVLTVRWSPSGRWLAMADDMTVAIWDDRAKEIIAKKTVVTEGSKDEKISVAWPPDEQTVAIAYEKTVSIYDVHRRRIVYVIEGHTSNVNSVGFSHDGTFLASRSADGVTRVWLTDSWNVFSVIESDKARGSLPWPSTLEFHPNRLLIATPHASDFTVEVWEIDRPSMLGGGDNSVSYMTAKIVLVGDSGVGKTGLGWRIARGEFKEHASTHGQQFWVVDEIGAERPDGPRGEAVLWDLAGQPDYRLVHALHLDDVDLALIVFDPTNRKDPLSGVEYWLKQLERSTRPWSAVLVGARVDRGAPTLTVAHLESYCEQHGIRGGYVSTSASTGAGVQELIDRVKAQIPWTEMPTTITTALFKEIKDYVLAFKAAPDANGGRRELLASPATLAARLRRARNDLTFNDAEFLTAVGHLQTHGFVSVLRCSNGELSILLAPEILTALASSFVNEARRNLRGLGSLEEDRLLREDYDFPELDGLTADERETLVDAAATQFLARNICFRESLEDGRRFLVFPSLINERRPAENEEVADDVSYRVTGAIENLYASLVVLLGYTTMFKRTNQWQDRAQYEMEPGGICGFRQIVDREDELQLVLYYGADTPEYDRMMFQGQFERFLSVHDLRVQRFRPVVCASCKTMTQWPIVMQAVREKRDVIFCHICGTRMTLPEEQSIEKRIKEEITAQFDVAKRRTGWEAALVSVNRTVKERQRPVPTCFVCYAWGVREHEEWVEMLAGDLRNAGLTVLFDRERNTPGRFLARYVDQVEKADFVLVVGTPGLVTKYDVGDTVVGAELRIVHERLREPKRYGEKVIPLLLDGERHTAFPALLRDAVSVDFRAEAEYFIKLLELVWALYELPFGSKTLSDIRVALAEGTGDSRRARQELKGSAAARKGSW